MDGCDYRLVGGFALSNGQSDYVYASHHEWVQFRRGESQDGFFCRFCLSTAYWGNGQVVVERVAIAQARGGEKVQG